MSVYSPYDYYPSPALDSKPVFSPEDILLDDKILDHDLSDFARRDSVWSHPDSVHSQHPHPQRPAAQPLFDSPFPRYSWDSSTPYEFAQAQAQAQAAQAQAQAQATAQAQAQAHVRQAHDSFDPDSQFGAVAFGQPFRFGQPLAGADTATASTASAADSSAPPSTAAPTPLPERRPRANSSYQRASASGSALQAAMRPDGIRKKNARFEIPSERTLSNIDALIGQASSEEDIKELKQQKRLLRNRQAALDSRQRKKVHTEQLEEENKRTSALLNEIQHREQEFMCREDEFGRENARLLQVVQRLCSEKEELIAAHTRETGNLRQQIGMLRDEVSRLEMGSQPPYYGVAESWDPDFDLSDQIDPPHMPPHMAAPAPAKDSKPALSFSWNAFYMCLLVGAFIASNSSAAVPLPRLSDEYRADSANVLKAVLASAEPAGGASAGSLTTAAAPLPSASSASPSAPTLAAAPTLSAGDMSQLSVRDERDLAGVDRLDALVAPTRQQATDQAFGVSAAQYRALTTLDDDDAEADADGEFDDSGLGADAADGDGDKTPRAAAPSARQPMTTLASALAAMRGSIAGAAVGSGKESAGGARSGMGLGERVPEQVLRDFGRLVHECRR